MTGEQLRSAHHRGENFFVGRGGGLQGSNLTGDITDGTWKQQLYQTNKESNSPPNSNWFRLADFMARLLPKDEPDEG
jgi:hypothetical protein